MAAGQDFFLTLVSTIKRRDFKLALSAFFNFSIILCCCVMMAAASENCTTVKDTRWATFTTTINLFYVGLRGVCDEGGAFTKFDQYTSGELANCGGASDVAITFTVFLFLCAISSFVMCSLRLRGNHSWWKVSILVSLAGVFCAIIALSTFFGKCSNYESNNMDLSVGNDLGYYCFFAMLFSIGLQVYATDKGIASRML